jgi:hypothetical protein
MSETVLKFQCGKCNTEGGPDLKAFAIALQSLMSGDEYTKERDTSIQAFGAIIRVLIECYMKRPDPTDKVHALLRYEMEFLFRALGNPEDEVVKGMDMFTRMSMSGVRKMLEKAREV